MQERQVEHYLGRQVKIHGGVSLKLTSVIGIPDRLVLLPEGRCVFVELKRSKEKARRIQVKRMEQLECLGFKTFVANSYHQVDELLRQVMRSGV